jgi:hypothetical protein
VALPAPKYQITFHYQFTPTVSDSINVSFFKCHFSSALLLNKVMDALKIIKAPRRLSLGCQHAKAVTNIARDVCLLILNQLIKKVFI